MHGLGNDFVVVEAATDAALPSAAAWRRLADRHTGIGFDQALVILPPRRDGTDAYWRIFNADGGEVEQCGNGARCVAEWLRLAGRTDDAARPLRLESAGGVIAARFDAPGVVSIEMGVPRFTDPAEHSLDIEGEMIPFTQVSMGNPHIVLRVSSIDAAPVATLGPALESHPMFPQRTNVGFLEVIGRDAGRLRVHERGAGETLACGTGVCATALLHALATGAASPVHVTVRGGDTMRVDFTKDADGSFASAKLTGPADFVFDGVISL